MQNVFRIMGLDHSMAVSDYTPVYMTGLEEVGADSNLKGTSRIIRPRFLQLMRFRFQFLKRHPNHILVKGAGIYSSDWTSNCWLMLLRDRLVDVRKKVLSRIKQFNHHPEWPDSKFQQVNTDPILLRKNQLQTVQTKEGNFRTRKKIWLSFLKRKLWRNILLYDGFQSPLYSRQDLVVL